MKAAYRKYIIYGLLSAALLFCLAAAGCGAKEKSEYVLYHLDEDGTALETDSCEVTADASGDVTSSLIEAVMETDPEVLFPEEVEITGYTLTYGSLILDFSETYYEMDAVREVLCRAAVVETILQSESVFGVYFTVAGEQLTDRDGNIIGRMTENTFISNPASQINSVQTATVVLYYTDSAGELLYPEQRTVHYNSSMSIEWMVVEQLIDGPQESSLSRTIPAETDVISVTTADGICYVNLDQTFQATTFSVAAETVIYSIVNSLCELEGIDEVQLAIDGSYDVIYQDTLSLNQSFEMNEDLIANDADPIETEVDAGGE